MLVLCGPTDKGLCPVMVVADWYWSTHGTTYDCAYCQQLIRIKLPHWSIGSQLELWLAKIGNTQQMGLHVWWVSKLIKCYVSHVFNARCCTKWHNQSLWLVRCHNSNHQICSFQLTLICYLTHIFAKERRRMRAQ